MNKRSIGKEFEQRAVDFLQDKGYLILERNYQCKFGEIDIIALDREYLVFVEVKYRKNRESGYPEEAVNYQKQRKISKTAGYYCLQKNILENVCCRFDVIAIDAGEIRHYENAFLYCG